MKKRNGIFSIWNIKKLCHIDLKKIPQQLESSQSTALAHNLKKYITNHYIL